MIFLVVITAIFTEISVKKLLTLNLLLDGMTEVLQDVRPHLGPKWCECLQTKSVKHLTLPLSMSIYNLKGAILHTK